MKTEGINMVNQINDANFENEVEKAEGVVVVDFWAPWCGPCKMLGPVIEEVSNEITNAKFTKINVDDNPVVSQKYRIASIPTVMIFKNGNVVETMVGFRPKAELEQLIIRNL